MPESGLQVRFEMQSHLYCCPRHVRCRCASVLRAEYQGFHRSRLLAMGGMESSELVFRLRNGNSAQFQLLFRLRREQGDGRGTTGAFLWGTIATAFATFLVRWDLFTFRDLRKLVATVSRQFVRHSMLCRPAGAGGSSAVLTLWSGRPASCRDSMSDRWWCRARGRRRNLSMATDWSASGSAFGRSQLPVAERIVIRDAIISNRALCCSVRH